MRHPLRAVAVVVAAAAIVAAAAASRSDGIPPLPSHGQVVTDRALFLSLARDGLAASRKWWWNEKEGWYNERLDHNFPPQPLLMLWSAYQLFEAYIGVSVAEPTAKNKAQVNTFGAKAEQYFNPLVKPVGAYAYYPGMRNTDITYYFDDSGWFGLAFLDAYRATGNRRFVNDAIKAFRFLDVVGWDARRGGFWWETKHRHKTSEPLAAAILIGARLYEITGQHTYLQKARRWTAWANAHSWNRARGLYQRSSSDTIVMSYVEGLMAEANAKLCKLTRQQSYCRRAELLVENSIAAFGVDLHWAPQYDAVYLQAVLDVYALDRNPKWYAYAYANAKRAAANAGDARGLYQLGWGGETIDLGQEVHPGQLSLHAATIRLFAWLAAARVPG